MADIGKFAPGLRGFPTPNAANEVAAYLVFYFTDDTWPQWVLGAVKDLVYEYNWYKAGGLTPNEAAESFRLIIEQAPYNILPAEVETPFWDDGTDVEVSEPEGTQPWYGYVENPTAPAGELTFVESALLWAFTGLVAVATFEVGGVAPAIFFHTTVEKFIIIQKRGDAAETIRYVIDNQDMKYVDTSPYAPGDLIKVQIIAPETGGGHDMMIISTVAS